MKKNLFCALLALTASNTFAAVEQDGIIRLEGYIYPSTCELDINNSGPNSATVQMGRHSASAFGKKGDEVGGSGNYGQVNVSLKNCPDTGELGITFNGPTVSGDKNILALDNATSSRTAQGVGVHIYSENDLNNPIALDGSQSLSKHVNSSQEFKESFVAKYVSTQNSVEAGEADATVNFKITYK